MKQKLKRLLPWIGYPLFYLFCFIIFCFWTFPYERVKERVIVAFAAAQKNAKNPQRLEIDELDSSFLTGVKLKGVRLISQGENGKPVTIAIDEARARISLLGLLVGSRDVTFKIDGFGGTIEGSFEESTKRRMVDLTFTNVEIGKVDAIEAGIGFPLDGRLSGTMKLELPEGKASKANGSLAIDVADVHAGNAKELSVKTPLGPFTLPRLKVGTLTISGEARDGVLKISKVATSGGDVSVGGDGRVQLRENAADANLDVKLKFKINDAYRQKNEKTQLLFGTPDEKQKPMLDMDARMAKSKTPDGYYQLHVQGTLAKPIIAPAASGSVSPSLPNLNFK